MTTRLINDDCIKTMQELIDEDIKVDLILTDPPYGTINGLSLDGYKNRDISWDTQLPSKEMLCCCEKLLRMNGTLILFSQEPYTNELRGFNYPNLSFIYPLYWFKDHFANSLSCKKAPVSYVEDISVFRKKYDTDIKHPLREYSKGLLNNIGISKGELIKEIGGKADHFFRSGSSQFELCTEETYVELINKYHIDKFKWFKPYNELKDIHLKFKSRYEPIFNLSTGKKFKGNVLKYKKPYNKFHPTEKPVDLLEDLICTYSNENDTVLDFTMGSGSTGVACQNTNRDFIGIELNKEYYDIAVERLKENSNQLKLL